MDKLNGTAQGAAMATVKHAFITTIADGPDPSGTLLQPSHWNQDHDITLGADENFVTDSEKTKIAAAIEDAPADGKFYVRCNNQWVELVIQ